MSENETIADIVAELQRCGDKWIDDKAKTTMECLGLIAIHSARRIEAAWKREKAEWEAAACAFVSDAVMSGKVAVEHAPVGNAAAMREALILCRQEMCDRCANTKPCKLKCVHVGIIDRALSAPPRNCDVGTAEEMCSRYGRYCRSHLCGKCEFGRETDDIDDEQSCIVRWMVSPYAEEGGEK